MLDRRMLGGRCPPLVSPGGSLRLCLLGGPPQWVLRTLLAQMAPVVAGGPVGPCGTLSPLFHEVLGPLEHSVLDHAGSAGQYVAVGPVGPYDAGGPVDPDGTLKVLEPLEHSVLDHADPAGRHADIQEVLELLEHLVLDHAGPAGQHAAVGPVGLFRTLSPSDCHPAGPYVAGGHVGPDGTLKVLEPLEHLVLNHADPADQHAVIQEVLEPLEHSVLNTALDGQPMEGIPVLEPLEHSVLEMTQDSRSLADWEPLAHSVLNVTLEVDLQRGYRIRNR